MPSHAIPQIFFAAPYKIEKCNVTLRLRKQQRLENFDFNDLLKNEALQSVSGDDDDDDDNYNNDDDYILEIRYSLQNVPLKCT